MCPIETPEGPNIGLIGTLSTYGRINPYGFVQTPYRKVAKGRVTDEINYLTADEEDPLVIAQANTPIDGRGRFTEDHVLCRRKGGEVDYVPPGEVDYMDVSPKQIVSVAASLIPILEHDDANRALMGANMQRQAVPLVRPEIPLIATGMEIKTAKDSGQVILAEADGLVTSVAGGSDNAAQNPRQSTGRQAHITVLHDNGSERRYPLSKFVRSNQGTCINHRALVRRGDRVTAGQPLADSSSTDSGELALGQTLLCAFMSWEGYNFEDAIIISETVARDDKFTSIHVEKHEVEARDTKLGPEEITRDIPNVGEESLLDLDEYGIVRVGANVQSGDILVGKITPKGETELTAEEKLLRAIFGEKAREVKDSSLRVPHGERGKVIETRFRAKEDNETARPAHGQPGHHCRWPAYAEMVDDLPAGVQAVVSISIAQRRKIAEGDKMAGRHGNKGVIARILPAEDMPHLEDGTPVDIILNPIGVPSRMNIGQVLETHLGWAARRMGFRAISPVFDGGNPKTIEDALCRAWICEQAAALMESPNGHETGGDRLTNGIGERVNAQKVNKWLESKGHDPAAVFDDSRVGEAARVGLELWLEQQGLG